jgi:hypothetical protein
MSTQKPKPGVSTYGRPSASFENILRVRRGPECANTILAWQPKETFGWCVNHFSRKKNPLAAQKIQLEAGVIL